VSLAPGDYDFLSNLSTVEAIVLGSILATLGGLCATQIEWQFEKRRREKQAALFIGELLSTLTVILALAKRVKGRGDPYGPVTLRMLRQAQREIGMYDRNREFLYNIRHADLRARIHTMFLRLSNPLEGIFDTTEEMRAVQTQLRTTQHSAEDRADLEARIQRLSEIREAGYEFIEETVTQVPGLVRDLEMVAGRSFANSGGTLAGI